MMLQNVEFYEEFIELSKVKVLPISVVSHSSKQIDSIAKSMSASKIGTLNPLTLAKVKSTYYLVDGSAIFDAALTKNITQLRARVCEIDSIPKAVILRIRLNQHGPSDNLGLLDAIDWLEKNLQEEELDRHSIINLCGLDDISARVEKVRLTTSAKEVMRQLREDVQARYSAQTIPMNILEYISKHNEKDQEKIATTIRNTLSLDVPEHKFAWQTIEQIEFYVTSILEPENSNQDIVYLKDTVDSSKNKTSTSKDLQKTVSKDSLPVSKTSGVTSADMQSIITNPSEMIMECEHGNIYKINVKEKTASSIKTKPGQPITLSGDHSKPLIAVPPEVIEKVGLDDQQLFIKTITTEKQLEALVKKLSNNELRLVVISDKKL